MSIAISSHNDHLVVTIKGRLDARFIQAQMKVLELLPAQIDNGVVFDLSSTDFIDSSGIGFLVYIYKRIKPKKCLMAILGLKGQPRDTIEMLSIHQLIDCVDSFDAFDQAQANKSAQDKEPRTRISSIKQMITRKRFGKKSTIKPAGLKNTVASRA